MGEAQRKRHTFVMGSLERIEVMLKDRLPVAAVAMLSSQEESATQNDIYTTHEELKAEFELMRQERDISKQYKDVLEELFNVHMKESLEYAQEGDGRVLGILGGDNKFKFINDKFMDFVHNGASDVYMRHAMAWMERYYEKFKEWLKLSSELRVANDIVKAAELRIKTSDDRYNEVDISLARSKAMTEHYREECETLREELRRARNACTRLGARRNIAR